MFVLRTRTATAHGVRGRGTAESAADRRTRVETGDELVCELFVVSGVDGPAGGRVAATPRAFRFPECVRARVE